jgi:DNA-binding CsgD family transcriptional regulator
MSTQMDRIEWKLDMLLMTMRGVGGGAAGEAAPPPQVMAVGDGLGHEERMVLEVMKGMSMKQHAALQMVVRGASNQEIADRFGVSVNTAKVYLRSISKRLGVSLRTQVAVKVLPVMRALGEEDYRALARGLPKNWDADYAFARREDDPHWSSYTGSRVKGEDGFDLDEEDEE